MPALQIVALDTATPQLRAPASGDTYTAPRAMDISPVALTGSAATSSLSIAQTWNTTGTPTGLKLNVTDTASNAASLLMDLQVGGTSQFAIDKAGFARVISNFGFKTPTGNWAGIAGSTFSVRSITSLNNNIGLDGTQLYLQSGGLIGWNSSTTNCFAASDLILARDAANTLAQRNGVNAQEKRVYGTFTDVSNHRRVSMGMSAAGVGFVRPEGAGTGATGNVLHISGLPTSNPGPGILWNNAGTVAIGT